VVQQAKNKIAVSAVLEENVTASYSEVICLHTGLPKSILSYAALYTQRSQSLPSLSLFHITVNIECISMKLGTVQSTLTIISRIQLSFVLAKYTCTCLILCNGDSPWLIGSQFQEKDQLY